MQKRDNYCLPFRIFPAGAEGLSAGRCRKKTTDGTINRKNNRLIHSVFCNKALEKKKMGRFLLYALCRVEY